ncbi:CaiB/BaiF CoA transferase family protein [Yanghanlia caeni]|uniref:CaiB/BaiF CoA-transferase family protein n=1 Tax=Yanghanlia caeni TaxID=3064283 RepID=A0ABU1D927_9BURK|nr:CaiB/BaiF CoA-transferase family protein [Alcaligenaceae bacterium LG-2]HLU78133.1 CaiB/BaiF CoA-transferase family protein [Burkholderiaceae bacterium]
MKNENMGAGGGAGPLSGYRVIELGSTVAGPFCARLMADFGADVIKVEQKEGDAVRSMGTQKDGRSLYAASILRNKRIISVDLRQQKGRDIVRRLCEKADIVIENFRPGTLERWGMGYDELARANPGLILVRISGYGQDGPYSQRPGYGVVCEAMSGIREVTGDPDRPPARVAVSMTDYITGLYGALGAVMAALDRHRTGRGQVVDSALYEAAFSFMEPHIPAYQQLGLIARRCGSRLPGHCPNTLFPTSDNRYIHITAGSQSIYKRLVGVMNRPDLLEDERFATPVARAAHEDEMEAIVSEWTQRYTLEELEQILGDALVPASRIFDMADIFSDPHYQAREMIVSPEDPELGPVAMANVVPRLSRTPGAVRWAGHDIGQDTESVLMQELGLTREALDALQAEDIIHSPTAAVGVQHD